MTDEHAALVRSLEAERARPDRRPPSVEELLDRLIGTLAGLYHDHHRTVYGRSARR